MSDRGGRPPATVVVYAVEVAVVLLVLVAAHGPEREWVLGAPILILASAGLLRGLWPAWLFLAIVAVTGVLDALIEWPAWSTLAVNGTMLALLVAPSTRRHARRGRPRFPDRLRRRGR